MKEKGYNIDIYDPFFHNNSEIFSKKYDFIYACEVIEHFHYPKREFEKLNQILKPEGILYLKTNLYHNDIAFDSWWYKNDMTHVFFYTTKSLEWIQDFLDFRFLKVYPDLIVLKK